MLAVCLLAWSSEAPGKGQQGLLRKQQTIRLPLEVLGHDGALETVQFQLPPEHVGPVRLWMRVHGLGYEGKATVRVNDSAWIPLRNDTAQVEGLGKLYGGIGGAYSTLRLSLPIPEDTLQPGPNWLSFRFNPSRGMTIGYRVLEFQLFSSDGTPLLEPSLFEVEDPGTWTPPRPEAVAEGEKLWRSKPLYASRLEPVPIRARCMDCHAQDGRDLKYFNYSNRAIIEASRFHGMSQEEGEKVASYIRSLQGVPTPGRPWNPPYQPGPGLDSRPVAEWSAGAGVDAVLERDGDLYAHLFPSGITPEAVATTGYLNVRETPIPIQLPDWNHWLPTRHPLDAWGDDFYNSVLNKLYKGEGSAPKTTNLRADFLAARTAGYTTLSQYRSDVREWVLALYNFVSARYPDPASTDTLHSQKLYSVGQWQITKMWELMHEFELEEHAKDMYPASRETRGWFDHIAFDISPNAMHLPRTSTGINNNTRLMHTYFSMAWYQVQLILFSGNHTQDSVIRNGQRPLDWPYVYGFLKDMTVDTGTQVPTGAWLVYWLTKAMQVHDNGLGPEIRASAGWNTKNVGNVTLLVNPAFRWGWTEISTEQRRQLVEALLTTWMDKNLQYTPQHWYDGRWALRDEFLTAHPDGIMGEQIKYLIPKARELGVDPLLLQRVIDWARSIWPLENWDAL